MAFLKTRLSKILFGVTIVLVAMVVLCVALFSPIAKYLIEKYDVDYLGRQVKVEDVYVNPFTGYVHINNLWISEAYKDTLFFSAKGVSGNFEMSKLFSNLVEITELDIDQPVGIVIQKKDSLNFNDLIYRFSPKYKKPKEKSGSKTHVSIDQLNIHDGVLHYMDRIIPIKYFVEKVNINCGGIRWNSDTIASAISFESRGGKTKGQLVINTKTLEYNVAATVEHQDLEIIRQYLWELINYGMFRATLDARIKAKGNFKNPRDITMQGRLAFSDFHLGKTTTYDYAAFKKFVLVMEKVSPVQNKFLFDSVVLDKSFFRYEHFDSLDNIQTMFGKKGSNVTDVTSQPGRFNLVIEISRYIKKIARNFFVSQYQIKRLALNDGEVVFNDYALNEKFSMAAHHVYLTADSISRNRRRVNFKLRSDLFPYGKAGAWLSLNPRDSGDLDLDYHFHNVPVSVFNPYLITYTSFPLDKGRLELNGKWRVRNGNISSENNLVVMEPRVAPRVKGEDIKRKLPLPLIMAFVRERGDIIDYKIPIKGNLKDPKFHFGDVIGDFFKNIFIKPPTIPYGLEVDETEEKIDKMLELTWPVHQTSFEDRQQKFLKKLAKFLEKHEQASIDVYAGHYKEREKEYILFYEAKKKYFLQTHAKSAQHFTRDDSIAVDKMSVKSLNHIFTRDMKKKVRDTTMFTMHDKCLHYLGSNPVEKKYRQLVKAREKNFRSYFPDNVLQRVKIHEGKDEIPYDGFSCFKIHYNGEIPKPLRRAYAQMNELNHGIFRRKLLRLVEKR